MAHSSPEEILRELDITLPVPTVRGAYIPSLVVGDLIYVSGQLPLQNGELQFSGSVGNQINLDMGYQAARLCFINALGALSYVSTPLSEIAQVVQISGYVLSANDFYEQPQVINGASDLCLKIFGDAGRHTRIAVGVSSLPLNASVEISAIFKIKSKNPE